jgi:toxin CptA
MHSAPSVTYPVERSRTLAWLMLGLALLGALSLACWALLSGGPGERVMAAVACLGVSILWAVRSWLGMPSGVLSWDGHEWQWVDTGHVTGGTLAVHLDAQNHLLLRFCPPRGAAHWCWAERSSAPGRWVDLRRAVYSRAKAATLPQAAQ